MMPGALIPFSTGVTSISPSGHFPTVILDMTRDSSSIPNPLHSQLQLVESERGSMVPQINDTMAAAVTSDPSFQAAVAAAVASFINGHAKL